MDRVTPGLGGHELAKQRLGLKQDIAGVVLSVALLVGGGFALLHSAIVAMFGSGAVESAHKQVVHARFSQAGMRWSEAGARRLLALRLLLLNQNWALLDHLRMVSLA